jgi:type IX secretion system PorP/SprF family membrane protein
MKRKIFIISMFLICTIGSQVMGQSRKYVSQFNHFQSYYNPGLTGYEGSALRGFVRNQWSGVEGAPKTYFLSLELDFGELGGLEDPALMGKNAASLNMLHDTYGAFRETELMGSYASRIRITDRHNLPPRCRVQLPLRQVGRQCPDLLNRRRTQPLASILEVLPVCRSLILIWVLPLPMKIIICLMACTM